jgi:hypothetical protein
MHISVFVCTAKIWSCLCTCRLVFYIFDCQTTGLRTCRVCLVLFQAKITSCLNGLVSDMTGICLSLYLQNKTIMQHIHCFHIHFLFVCLFKSFFYVLFLQYSSSFQAFFWIPNFDIKYWYQKKIYTNSGSIGLSLWNNNLIQKKKSGLFASIIKKFTKYCLSE